MRRSDNQEYHKHRRRFEIEKHTVAKNENERLNPDVHPQARDTQ